MSVPLGVGGRETPSRPIPWETGGMNLYTSYVDSNITYCRFRIDGHIRRFHRQRSHRQKTTRPRRVQNRPLVRRISGAFPTARLFRRLHVQQIRAVDHWIIFGLLALIGGNMVREAFEEDEENAKETADFDWKHMLPLAVACSIDAFAVGVSFAFMSLNIWISVIIIGITTGLISAAGLYIGRAFGSRWQKPAQIAGGVVLILIGVKVLLEHLGFLA